MKVGGKTFRGWKRLEKGRVKGMKRFKYKSILEALGTRTVHIFVIMIHQRSTCKQ